MHRRHVGSLEFGAFNHHTESVFVWGCWRQVSEQAAPYGGRRDYLQSPTGNVVPLAVVPSERASGAEAS